MKTMIQKWLLISFTFVGFGLFANSVPPEACWTTDPKSTLEDGSFGVEIGISDYSKEEVLQVMRVLNSSVYVHPTGYPYLSEKSDSLYVTLKAQNASTLGTRQDFQNRTNQQMHIFQALRNAKVSCVYRMHPNPSTTGSN